ncbi:uncharacterized protein LOC131677353 [Topomyia yanbarensis]|uniref:uncharacterized protein LOC131677353 n=1 Tax=Topomyia yanbarensis TaxID=2498891 RepID=UPI00273BACD4|nr:uncharacterized protein LOC131677353 [Topomyia yanbarensis]
MPRVYKSSGKKRIPINPENLKLAVWFVSEGNPIKTTARIFDVPVMTLKRYSRRQKATEPDVISYQPDYRAHSRAFSNEEETLLADYIEMASKLNHGITPLSVRKLAFQFAIQNGTPIAARWKNEIAGVEWYYGFMRRCRRLSLRVAEPTSLSRATSFNRNNVEIFFENLRSLMNRFSFGPESIWNIDETGLTTVHKPKKILAPKGTKQVSKATSGERGELVTACCAINARGENIPPFMVFPRKNWQDRMLNNSPVGTQGCVYPSGWMTAPNFVKFLEHFVKYAKCSIENPSLIIMDNHDSHTSIDSLNFAKSHGIHLLTIPPHTSHKLQPLDRTVYGPLKAYYNSACDDWMAQHGGKTITIYEIAECFAKAFTRAFTAENIRSGFRVSGIHPLNSNIFNDADYLLSYVTDRPIPQNEHPAENDISIQEITAPKSTSEASPFESGNSKDRLLYKNEPTTVAKAPQQSRTRCRRKPARFRSVCAKETKPSSQVTPSVNPPTPENKIIKLEQFEHSNSTQSNGCMKIRTPEEIQPFPKASPRKNNRKGRKRGETQILTDTPVKIKLEAALEIKQEKYNSQEKGKKKGKKSRKLL